MSNILSAVAFNEMQNNNYTEYCVVCKANNVQPEPQSRYFPTVPVKYGYVRFNSFGEYTWNRLKKNLQ